MTSECFSISSPSSLLGNALVQILPSTRVSQHLQNGKALRHLELPPSCKAFLLWTPLSISLTSSLSIPTAIPQRNDMNCRPLGPSFLISLDFTHAGPLLLCPSCLFISSPPRIISVYYLRFILKFTSFRTFQKLSPLPQSGLGIYPTHSHTRTSFPL